MPFAVVAIEGLDEARRSSPDMRKALDRAARNTAKLQVPTIRSYVASGGPAWGRVVPTVRGTASAGSVTIGVGKGVPQIFGLEFGADRNRPRVRRYQSGRAGTAVGYRQFRAWRGSGSDAGYRVYPAVRSVRERVREMFLDEVAGEIMKLPGVTDGE